MAGEVIRPMPSKTALAFCSKGPAEPGEETRVVGFVQRFDLPIPERQETRQVTDPVVAGRDCDA